MSSPDDVDDGDFPPRTPARGAEDDEDKAQELSASPIQIESITRYNKPSDRFHNTCCYILCMHTCAYLMRICTCVHMSYVYSTSCIHSSQAKFNHKLLFFICVIVLSIQCVDVYCRVYENTRIGAKKSKSAPANQLTSANIHWKGVFEVCFDTLVSLISNTNNEQSSLS